MMAAPRRPILAHGRGCSAPARKLRAGSAEQLGLAADSDRVAGEIAIWRIAGWKLEARNESPIARGSETCQNVPNWTFGLFCHSIPAQAAAQPQLPTYTVCDASVSCGQVESYSGTETGGAQPILECLRAPSRRLPFQSHVRARDARCVGMGVG